MAFRLDGQRQPMDPRTQSGVESVLIMGLFWSNLFKGIVLKDPHMPLAVSRSRTDSSKPGNLVGALLDRETCTVSPRMATFRMRELLSGCLQPLIASQQMMSNCVELYIRV